MKIAVISLGCKVNQYEGQSMMARFEEGGYEVTDAHERADAYVINTCSVTSEADRKSRQYVAKVLKLNPEAFVYVCGCSSQNAAQPYLEKPNVSFVGGTGGKIKLANSIMTDIVRKKSAAYIEKPLKTTVSLPDTYEDDLSPKVTRTRGFMKIQDGCNQFCSYCIVPYLRGRSRSRPLESVLSEAGRLAAISRELVLTGINLSAYGKDFGSSLADLIRAMGKVPARKRLGSLECQVIDDDFLSAMRDNGFCNHFHLSMQSGSDEVLKKMNRHYTSSEFLQKVDKIRHYFPDAGITTDIITGFPTETEENHRESLRTVSSAAFSDMHVFPYSVREGTAAAHLPQIDKSIRQQRAEEMTALKDVLKKNFLSAQLGKTAEVYVEEAEGDYHTGYTSNYIKVYTCAPIHSMSACQLKEIYSEGVLANE